MANDQSLAAKLRVRATDGAGKPLASIRVELMMGEGGKTGGGPLRELHTNADGFAIFSLRGIDATTAERTGLAVRFAGSEKLQYGLDTAVLSAASRYSTFQLPSDAVADLRPGVPFAWVDDGIDADDVWAIPGIFPDLGDLKFGDDYCGRLVPKDQTVRIFERDHVVRTARNVLSGVDTNRGDIELADQGTSYGVQAGMGKGDGTKPPIWLHEGKLLHCEIKWTRLGYTFGDLLYSLPLAPCESVTLAVSNWQRLQLAQAEQTSTSAQSQSASYSDKGSTADALSAMSSNTQSSSAHGWAVGAALGATGGHGWITKATAALGVSYSSTKTSSTDVHQFASNATHDFSDSIQQSAEGWRQDHQVVVMEQSDTQNQAISYRTVCNNNHCHVLNIFYHEVLNNFRVCSRFMGSREVYFVPYAVRTFDADLAFCSRPFLLPYLLDKDLVACYDDTKWVMTAPPVGPVLAHKIRIEIKFNTITDDNGIFYLTVNPGIGGASVIAVPRSDFWQAGTVYTYEINTADFDPASPQSVGIMTGFGGGSPLNMHMIAVDHVTISVMDPISGQWVVLGTGTAPPHGGIGPLSVSFPASYTPPPPPPAAPGADCLSRLLHHLNCNKMYYNSLLWLFEDPNERIYRFDRILFGNDRLTDLIDPTPLAVMGDYVAFAKADSPFEPWTGEPILDERLVTVPTPGIFADAALGQCTTCEKVDDGVYWNWKDTPCSCAGNAVTLAQPATNSLFPATGPFLSYPTQIVTAAAPPTAATATNGLVSAFGSALATAMFGGDTSAAQMTALATMMGKLTDMLNSVDGSAKPAATPATGDKDPPPKKT